MRCIMRSVFVILLAIFVTSTSLVAQNNRTTESEKKMKFTKRSVVMAQNGMVATSQPLAAQAGLDILKKGGNAIDAAVATAAVLNVVEPMMTGIGGDAFIMIYMADEKRVTTLNASGRSSYTINRDKVLEKGHTRMPNSGILSITVPGAFDGWCTVLEKYGSMKIGKVLEPAIYYAENGFPVTEIIQGQWESAVNKMSRTPDAKNTYLIDGRAPAKGEIFKSPNFAKTLRYLAKEGRDGFYKGDIAKQIVSFIQENGGFMTLKDLEDHTSTWIDPIHTDYKNYTLYECPPNGQGIAALEMLNILENVDLKSLGHNSPEYLHYLIEAKKLAYADLSQWIGDPEFNKLPVEKIISKQYGKEQFERIDPKRAAADVETGISHSGDTIYLTVMDKHGNAVSFINSVYNSFGSGLVAGETGICLQNRGGLFTLEEGHVNMIEPNKRPFHTIIPAMAFKDGEFFMTYGVMGGAMQPQGHAQVLLNIVEFGMDMQEAIESPRFRHYSGARVMIEPEVGKDVLLRLAEMGHQLIPHRPGSYGGGQGIMYIKSTGVLMGGSDFRKDGCAVGW